VVAIIQSFVLFFLKTFMRLSFIIRSLFFFFGYSFFLNSFVLLCDAPEAYLPTTAVASSMQSFHDLLMWSIIVMGVLGPWIFYSFKSLLKKGFQNGFTIVNFFFILLIVIFIFLFSVTGASCSDTEADLSFLEDKLVFPSKKSGIQKSSSLATSGRAANSSSVSAPTKGFDSPLVFPTKNAIASGIQEICSKATSTLSSLGGVPDMVKLKASIQAEISELYPKAYGSPGLLKSAFAEFSEHDSEYLESRATKIARTEETEVAILPLKKVIVPNVLDLMSRGARCFSEIYPEHTNNVFIGINETEFEFKQDCTDGTILEWKSNKPVTGRSTLQGLQEVFSKDIASFNKHKLLSYEYKQLGCSSEIIDAEEKKANWFSKRILKRMSTDGIKK
jgi:hypothetical protein